MPRSMGSAVQSVLLVQSPQRTAPDTAVTAVNAAASASVRGRRGAAGTAHADHALSNMRKARRPT